MSNELLAAFGITDEDLKKASDEKSSSSRSGKKKTTKKKSRNMLCHSGFAVDAGKKYSTEKGL